MAFLQPITVEKVRVKNFISAYVLLLSLTSFAQTKVQNTLTAHLVNPIGIETTQSRCSNVSDF